MKNCFKWLLPIFLILTLCTGCGQGAAKVAVAQPGYTCNFKTEYNGLLLTGTVTVRGADALTLTVAEPQTVAGICFEYERGTAKLIFKNREFSSANNKQLSGIAGALGGVLGQLSGEREITAVNGAFVQQGTANGTPYRLTFNGEGFVQQLEIPTMGVSVSFTGWKYL